MKEYRPKGPVGDERWKAIALQYSEFDRCIELFSGEAGARCPSGCGICCTGAWEPEVTAPEAEFVARYIIEAREDLQQHFELLQERECCIFYDHHNPYHCMIYSVRPVICRGFGFSGYTDKNGSFIYRPCRHMECSDPRKTPLSGPVLSDFQAQYTLEYREVLPISEAVFNAWQKLQYRFSLEAHDSPENRE